MNGEHVEVDIKPAQPIGPLAKVTLLYVGQYDDFSEFPISHTDDSTITLKSEFPRAGHHSVTVSIRKPDGVTVDSDGQCFVTPDHATLSHPYGDISK